MSSVISIFYCLYANTMAAVRPSVTSASMRVRLCLTRIYRSICRAVGSKGSVNIHTPVVSVICDVSLQWRSVYRTRFPSTYLIKSKSRLFVDFEKLHSATIHTSLPCLPLQESKSLMLSRPEMYISDT